MAIEHEVGGWVTDLLGQLSGNQALSTLILLLVVIIVRYGTNRYLDSHAKLESEQRRRIRVNVRAALFLIAALSLVIIWAPALRSLVFSIAAFTVAIIIATKELILCLSGTVLATTGDALRIGSWVEIGAVRGEVVDRTLMTTTLQELGRDANAHVFTGRTIVVPNSLFLNVPIANERFHKRFVFHTATVVFDAAVDPAPVEEAMVDAVTETGRDSAERARRYMSAIEARADVTMPSPAPTPRVVLMADGRVKVAVTAFLPTQEAHRIEQAAVKAGLAAVRAQLSAS